MKKFVKFFIENSKVVNLVVIAILLVGIGLFIGGKKEGFPQVSMDWLWISAIYPGATAQEVETLVTDKIEEAIEKIDGAKKITSQSVEGMSIINYQVDSDYSDEFDQIHADVKNAIDSIQDFPEDVHRALTGGSDHKWSNIRACSR